MSDIYHHASPSTQTEDLLSYIGFNGSEAIPLDMTKALIEISGILSQNDIDPETGLGILKSYEAKVGKAEDIELRVKNFVKFLKGFPGKESLLNSIKNMGLYSKQELEEYAKDTGDWSHFLRRLDQERKAKK